MNADELERRRYQIKRFAEGVKSVEKGEMCTASNYLFGLGLPVPECLGHRTWSYKRNLPKDGKYIDVLTCPYHSTSGEIISYFMIYLENDRILNAPTKALMLDSCEDMRGGALRLSEVTPQLGIALGIENAIAASVLYGMNVWAAPDLQLYEKFNPPREVRELVIFSDNRLDFKCQRAAYTMATRLHEKGRPKVVLVFPDGLVSESYTDMMLIEESERKAFYH